MKVFEYTISVSDYPERIFFSYINHRNTRSLFVRQILPVDDHHSLAAIQKIKIYYGEACYDSNSNYQ